MTKPMNFPGRRHARQMKAQGITVSPEKEKHSTKKTPKSVWTAARAAHHGGRIGR